MITVLPAAGMVHFARVNVAFSAHGRWGACLRADDEDLALEQWTLAAEEAVCQTIPDIAVTRRTHPLPLDDGRILLLRSKGTSTSGRHALMLLQPGGRGILRQRLADIPGLGSYLVPSPNSGQLGFLVTIDDPEHSTSSSTFHSGRGGVSGRFPTQALIESCSPVPSRSCSLLPPTPLAKNGSAGEFSEILPCTFPRSCTERATCAKR